jgi:CRISPR/Cas system CSM-associated protein Csm3 (group 7 of RAMP superfamily)
MRVGTSRQARERPQQHPKKKWMNNVSRVSKASRVSLISRVSKVSRYQQAGMRANTTAASKLLSSAAFTITSSMRKRTPAVGFVGLRGLGYEY